MSMTRDGKQSQIALYGFAVGECMAVEPNNDWGLGQVEENFT